MSVVREQQVSTSALVKHICFGGVTIGGLICNDLWGNPMCTPMDDPHLLMKLSKMGARVVFHGVNGGRNQDMFCEQVIRLYHESNQHIRTMAARVWLVTVDNAAPHDLPTAAPGGVIAPDGTWAYQTPTAGDVPPLSVSLILTSDLGTFQGGTSVLAGASVVSSE